MKRWPWIIVGLYAGILVVFAIPAALVALPGTRVGEAAHVLAWPPYWIWLGMMLVSQWALLAVPVRVAAGRPVTRGPVWRTVLGGGFMAGTLAGGVTLSLYEFFKHSPEMTGGCLATTAALGGVTWLVWALIFFRSARKTAPADLVSRQCKWLLTGSVLELLVAVPTHVIARHRDYCCAGLLTFIGLSMGASVMLFAFGPALLVLFTDRWKRLHPGRDGGGSSFPQPMA